jgi:hypothetical protein
MTKKNEINKKKEYLDDRGEKRIIAGKKIRNRVEFRNSTRFLVDKKKKIIHDTANEKAQCHLDELFKSGFAETFTKTAPEAVSEGFATCPKCIGKSPKNTFDGRSSLLITIFSPNRVSRKDVQEKEHIDINRSLDKDIFGQLSVIRELHKISAKRNISRFVLQVRRMRKRDLPFQEWGEPDLIVSFTGEQKHTLTREDDVLGVVYFPKNICQNEKNITGFQDSTLFEIFSLAGVRKLVSSHFQDYGYRDLALYYHICDTIDHNTLHQDRI